MRTKLLAVAVVFAAAAAGLGSVRPVFGQSSIDGLANERPMPCIATAEMRMTGPRDEKNFLLVAYFQITKWPLRLGALQLRVAATQRDPGHQRAA